MANAELLWTTDTFRILVVDDEKVALDDIKECLYGIEGIEVDLIDEPEKINDFQVTEKAYHMVILDIRFEGQNKIQYSLSKAKSIWTDAIIMILSHYDSDLSEGERKEADIILNKAKLILEPELLCRQLMEIIPGHRIQSTPAARELLRSIRPLRKLKREIELYRMTGYVLGQKGEYIEAVVYEEIPEVVYEEVPEGRKWQKILILASLFIENGLESSGTPFIYRIFATGGKVITTVELNPDADEQAEIPDDIEELIARQDEQDERLRRENLNGK